MHNLFDRRSLEALEAVYNCNGFEAAASVLGISQSAVSHRFKSLQNACGAPLLIRSHPYELTSRGKALLDYLQTLKHLEATLIEDFGLGIDSPSLRIGVSRDMLDTWLLNFFTSTPLMENLQITIITEDQEETLRLLKKGEVNITFSPSLISKGKNKPVYIGNMTYILAATPKFKEKFFPNNIPLPQSLLKAPCLVYDRKDSLYFRYLKKHWHFNQLPSTIHTIPSVFGFKQITLAGKALALIPYADIKNEIQSKTLVNLFPQHTWEMPLYLYTSSHITGLEKKIINQIIKASQFLL